MVVAIGATISVTGPWYYGLNLPAYAPELNPVEYLWGHLKEHELGNLLVRHAHELGHHATAALRRLRRRPTIIAACWKQSSLAL